METDPLKDPLLADVPVVDGKKVLEPCVLERAVGGGAMGRVYKARHKNLGVDVAVKVLKKELARQDTEFVERFRREAQSAAQIAHSNVVRVFDVSESCGVHYLVMEFVEGEDIRQRIQRSGKLDIVEAAQIAHGAARGLAAAHRRGMVHRDIKPDNIMISVEGEVKVTDLGLARPGEGPGLTRSNVVMGTPQYMPPEQWESASQVGPTADVWALGATLYYMLTGEHAVQGKSFAEVHRAVKLPLPDLREKRPELDESWAELIARCTDPDPSKRFPTAVEFVDALHPLIGSGQLMSSMPTDISVERTMMVGSEMRTAPGLDRTMATAVGAARTVVQSGSVAAEPGPAPDTQVQRRTQTLLFALLVVVIIGAVIAAVALQRGGDTEQAVIALEGDWPPSGPLYITGSSHRLELRISPAEERVLRLSLSGVQRTLASDSDGLASAELLLPEDGEYPLSVEGEGVARIERSIVRDTVLPSLVAWDPPMGARLQAGSSQTFRLEFDEPVRSGALGEFTLSTGASERELVVDLTVPAATGPWAMAWLARDLAGMVGGADLSWTVVSPAGASLELAGELQLGAQLLRNSPELPLSGRLLDASTAQFVVVVGELEQSVSADDQGAFSTTLALEEGSNRIELFHEGRSLGAVAVVVVDSAAPVVRVLEPSATVTNERSLQLRVSLEDDNRAGVSLDGAEMSLQADGSYLSDELQLAEEGTRSFVLIGRDQAGNSSELTFELRVDHSPPLVVSLTQEPGGPLAPRQPLEIDVLFDEQIASLTVGGDAATILDAGSRARVVTTAPSEYGPSVISWRAVDLAGNVSSDDIHVVVRDPWGDAPNSMRDDFLIVGSTLLDDAGRSMPAQLQHLDSGVNMLWVPSGEFTLGSPAGDPDRRTDERAVRVRVSGFYMARFETSRREWEDGRGGALLADALDDDRSHPARGMNWIEAQNWCASVGLALPSEAQWEYAASGAEDRRYPWGADFELGRCVSGEDPGAQDSPFPELVGTLGPQGASWCGVQNLGGNVREWCRDIYVANYGELQDGVLDPVQDAGTRLRVRRGGYYTSGAAECRGAARYSDLPTKENIANGFRAVFELPSN